MRTVMRTARRLGFSIGIFGTCSIACILHVTAAAAQPVDAGSSANGTRGPSPIALEAAKLEDSGLFREALARWKRADAAAPTPTTALHVGLCEGKTGALLEAATDLDRAIALARAAQSAEVEAAAQQALGDVRARTPVLQIDVDPGSAATRVILDGTELSPSTLGTPMPLDPGPHTAVVVFGARRVEKSVTLVERDVTKIAVGAPVAGASEAGATPAATPDDPTEPDASPASSMTDAPTMHGRPGSVVPYFLLLSGLVVTGGGVTFWVFRANEIKALDAQCPTRVHCDPSLQPHDSNGKLYTSASLAFLSTGIIGMGWGAGMLIFGGHDDAVEARRERTPHTASVGRVVARAVTLVARSVVPEALPGGGGASVIGRF